MKTKTIFKVANKLVWDTIWYGFWVLLLVVIVAKPPMFFNTYYYSEGYSNPYITSQSEFEAPEGSVELTKESDIVKFYEMLQPRVEFLRIALLTYMIFAVLWHYKDPIIMELDNKQQQNWLQFEADLRNFIFKLKQKIKWE